MSIFLLAMVTGVLVETTYLCFLGSRKKGIKSGRGRKIFVDTSSLIDGRILEVAKTGFLSDDYLIPKSVIRELQLLADGKDSEKRARARAGMEIANELERVVFINAEILDDSELGRTPVDERLLILAKDNRGVVLTCDYNLEKVAKTEGIEVLNINNLAIVLSNKFVEGDKFKIKILERGSNKGQGVGHLKDGTMVVIDRGEKLIGKTVEVEFVRFLQTSSGRIIFATLTSKKKR